MTDKKIHSADILMKMTWMRDHPAFRTTDCEINQIDWAMIDSYEFSYQEGVMIEVLRFLLTGSSNAQLEDLLALNDTDLYAVILALGERFKIPEFEERF